MKHVSQHDLLDVYYGESSPRKQRRVDQHLSACKECRDYLQFLAKMQKACDRLPEEAPQADTFDRIVAALPPERPRIVPVRPTISAMPFFQIGFLLMVIMLVIYVGQSKLTMLPVWETMEQFWLIQTIGGFGLATLLFLALGTFLSLSIAPILYFDSHKSALP